MFNWFKKIASFTNQVSETKVAANQGDDYISQLEISESENFKDQGNIYLNNGQLNEAAACFRQAIARNPNYVEAHYNLGLALKDIGQLNGARDSYRCALKIKPDFADAHYKLGNVLNELGQFDETVKCYRKALEIKPDYLYAYVNLGNALKELGQLNDAVANYHRALEIKPDFAEVHYNMGIVQYDLGRLDDAVISFRRALELKPDYAEAISNLGGVLRGFGQTDEAVASYRRALLLKPGLENAHGNLLFTLDLSASADMEELHEERKKWDAAYAAPLWQNQIHTNDPTAIRRLRIGYVSADFKDHSAARVFGGMLIRYDRSQFEAYSNHKGKDDMFTELFRQNVTVWRNIANLSDEAVVKVILEDRIDILVDLSGHTTGNRLLVFARKPAPIQITAWGYATGTGMRAMDVFFTDPVMVPSQDKQYFTEEIQYLPSVVGSFFTHHFPDINELPALADGNITFGSFNRLAKVSKITYRAWSEVLLAIPRSRLILKAPELSDPTIQKLVISNFVKEGGIAEQIIMLGRTPWYEHMHAYNQVDIALDPFPHGGGVTALEGLMMGVPMITLRWPTVVGRLSASIMTTLGLPDWIAETPEQYVQLAIQKASDLQSLAALRQRLRDIFTSSVIGDPAAYAKAVEKKYRQLWQEWCARRNCTF